MRPVRGSARASLVRLLAVLAVAALAAGFNPGQANADPDVRLHAVQQKVDTLNEKVDKVTEEYDRARLELHAAKRRARSLTRQADEQQAKVERLRRAISVVAMSAYMGGGTDLASLATAKSPQDLVDKAASLEQISAQDSSKIADFNRENKALAVQRAAASRALGQQRQIAGKLKDKKSSILDSLGKQKRLLAQLVAAGQERASRSSYRTPIPTDLPPASGRAATAVAFAKAQLGKPYVWGADGPGSYDCSGLTMAAWAAAGVSLPHSSAAQYSSGTPVPRSQLQPGDLVFFYSPIHHVGLYVGGGMMIDAPHTGAVVEYKSIDASGPYTGAVRVG